MDERSFISEIRRIFQLSPAERITQMILFHRKIHEDFIRAVQSITQEQAESVSSDGRLVKQVVGHIMEWERFTLLCLGQLLSGVKTRRILWKNGYVDTTGEPFNFGSIDAFNAFQAEYETALPWSEIQARAVDVSTTLVNLLSSPDVFTPTIFEESEVISPELYDKQRLPIPGGWFLWYVILDHEAVEHARDLYPA